MGSIATLRPTLELDQVVDAVMSGRDQSLARAETLPPDAYISEPFFRLEGERIFAREWLCVGHVGQFPAIGDYRPIDLFGELLVVVRAADRIRVMSRVCPHRWAPLVNAPGHAKFFSCPFHKWAFALDGSLLGAPLMDRVEFDGHDCRLTDYRSEIIDGFIYMTFDADAAPLTPRLQDCSADLEAYHLDELVPGFVIDYDLAINWKFIVETFMECYHHIAAHPDTFEKLHPARATYVKDGSQAWTVGHAPLRPDAPDDAVLAGFPLLGDLTPAQRREFRLYLIYPCHLLITLPDRVGWFCVQPLGPQRSRLQTHLLLRPEARQDPAYEDKIAREKDFFATFNDEDIAVNEMQMKGVATKAARAGRLCDLEKAIWQFAGYVRDRIGA